MTTISLCDHISASPFVALPFYRNGVPLADGARWGMTVRTAGSMRFRWNEENPCRTQTLQKICGIKTPVPLELIHSKTVYVLNDARDTWHKQGDGMLTQNRALVPVVTVADCMPLFLYDEKTGVFGAFHSGWKGTGIIAEGIALAEQTYGARREDLLIAIGAHIHDCCYSVDEARADYFANTFTPDCVEKIEPSAESTGADKAQYRLSLLKANLAVLARAGIRAKNIVVASDCTSCTQDARGDFPFGSFRRQAAFLPDLTTEERARKMTVQAAFCGWL